MKTEKKPRVVEMPTRMEDRRRIKLLTGHTAAPVLWSMGWWLIEEEPGSEIFMFSHDPDARAIIERHNALWREKHGDAAADEYDAAHARLCARVRAAEHREGDADAIND